MKSLRVFSIFIAYSITSHLAIRPLTFVQVEGCETDALTAENSRDLENFTNFNCITSSQDSLSMHANEDSISSVDDLVCSVYYNVNCIYTVDDLICGMYS